MIILVLLPRKFTPLITFTEPWRTLVICYSFLSTTMEKEMDLFNTHAHAWCKHTHACVHMRKFVLASWSFLATRDRVEMIIYKKWLDIKICYEYYLIYIFENGWEHSWCSMLLEKPSLLITVDGLRFHELDPWMTKTHAFELHYFQVAKLGTECNTTLHRLWRIWYEDMNSEAR